MALDQPLSVAEQLTAGIQLHAMAVETSQTAFADTVAGPLKQAAELIGDEEVTLGSSPEETAQSLRDAGIDHADSVAARIHIIADGGEPSVYV